MPINATVKPTNIVDDPVMAKTVHIRNISRYHANVCRSGIGLAPRNRCQKVVDTASLDSDATVELVLEVVTVSLEDALGLLEKNREFRPLQDRYPRSGLVLFGFLTTDNESLKVVFKLGVIDTYLHDAVGTCDKTRRTLY